MTDEDGDKCPHCGTELETGFGLAGGGYGPYTFCPSEDCRKYFDKVQERQDEAKGGTPHKGGNDSGPAL